jgi:hypothetical protein
MGLKRHQKDRGFGYKKAIQYPTDLQLEKVDNMTNEIMDKLRDIVDRIDLKHYINNNTDEDIGDLDDEIYSIIYNELITNLNE